MYYSNILHYLILLTKDLTLYKFRISKQGKMKRDKKIKLSAKHDGKYFKCVWCGNGLLAAVNSEKLIRLYSLEDNDNYFLTNPNEYALFNCLAYDKSKRLLATGDNKGTIIIYRYKEQYHHNNPKSSKNWSIVTIISTSFNKNGILSLSWGKNGLLSAIGLNNNGLSIITQTYMHCQSYKGLHVIQTATNQLYATMNNKKSYTCEYATYTWFKYK